MENEQQKLWQEFKAKAEFTVINGYYSISNKNSITKMVIKINKLPSFENIISWRIYEELIVLENITRFIGLRREWLKLDDYNKFENPLNWLKYKFREDLNPTITNNIIELSVNVVEMIKRLENCKFPGFKIIDNKGGLDGTSYELCFGEYWSGIKLNWWEEGPNEWNEIITITNNIFNVLENECIKK